MASGLTARLDQEHCPARVVLGTATGGRSVSARFLGPPVSAVALLPL